MLHADCYHAIEKELDRRGLDYEIHGLPGAEDIIHFEEYWVTNLPESTMLFPAIVDAGAEKDLDGMIVRAIQAHLQNDNVPNYYVVLCGEGWTEERVEDLRRQVAARLRAGVPLTIESLERFTLAG